MTKGKECEVSEFSSRTCELGTKSCQTDHKEPMTRVKGGNCPTCEVDKGWDYIIIPASAIRCEATVYSNRDSGWMQQIERLPAHLIGRKVEVIIIEKEKEK